jgi:hypothetical protein
MFMIDSSRHEPDEEKKMSVLSQDFILYSGA